MSSSDVAIRVQGLSKCYEIYATPQDRLKQFIFPYLQRLIGQTPKQYFREFWALKDVSFEIKKGETVGIIGRNGSGKSTLLQMICGTLSPTSGSIQTHGRIAALLELGSGFNPEFTGRENVYMNATVLGLSKIEIDARFDDIASFADIGDFIELPIKTYSSGMSLRLAFSVAINVYPDVLIVDEALSVGDARFQAKCYRHLIDLKNKGTTILLVTHSTEDVLRHCDRAGLIDGGHFIGEFGDPKLMVNRYVGMFASNDSPIGVNLLQVQQSTELFSSRQAYNPNEFRSGNGGAKFTDFRIIVPSEADGRIFVELDVTFYSDIDQPLYGLFIRTVDGVTIFFANSEQKIAIDSPMQSKERGDEVTVQFSLAPNLYAGDYFLSIAVSDISGMGKKVLDRRHDAIHLAIKTPVGLGGIVNMHPKINIQKKSQEQTK